MFSTDAYACNFRRNNSFILLTNGCFAYIKACFAVSCCDCGSAECACFKHIILFATCCMSTRSKTYVDSYAGIDYRQFICQVTQNDDAMIVVRTDDIICKAVIVEDIHKIFYALRLPQLL